MKPIFLGLLCALIFSCRGNSQEAGTPGSSENPGAVEYAVQKTDAQWRKELTDMEYFILRKAGTENPGSSEWLKNREKGTYVCAGCGHPLFKSEHKFNSGSGWPSFDREIEGNVAFSVDYKIGYKRTEEHCARCGGHLGHVFEDGPRETTGLRHCINGAALDFIPEN
ncbi:MAG: peptide-methionine (R)-S-oxide reductase MsrB [Robiginitalea sp.]|nr:MAG: peptide-methionine (R)-S-oxide reductase MsrB [Flavobacteriaceae bacterium]